MRDWKKYKFSECIKINPKVSLKKGDEYSFVEMKDLSEDFRKYVYPSQIKKYKGGSKFHNRDTLFARITPCLENGKICQVKKLNNEVGFGSTEFLVFRNIEGITTSEYVYYLAKSPITRRYAENKMTGTSGRQRVSKDVFNYLYVNVPSIDEQNQITEILSSLDDKIELNLEMNRTLEEMAMAIYKEWFVDFGPFRDGEFVDSELGPIPKGWEVKKLKDLIEFSIGGDWGKDTPTSNYIGAYIIRGTDLPSIKNGERNKVPYRYIKENSFTKRKLLEGDILVEISGGSKEQPTGRNLYISKNILIRFNNTVVPASFCRLVRPINPYVGIVIAMHLKRLYFKGGTWIYQNQSTGISNFQFKYFINNEVIPIPRNMQILIGFYELLKPIIDLISSNENIFLSETRDYLLPKLISGEIRVKEAEAEVEKLI